MDRDRAIEPPEPLPSVEDYPALKDARARLRTLEAEEAAFEVGLKEHSRMVEALTIQLAAGEDEFLLGQAPESDVTSLRETLRQAETTRLQAQADTDAHGLRVRRMRSLIVTIEDEAQHAVLAQLTPLHRQALQRLAAALDEAVQAHAEMLKIQEAARIRTPYGWQRAIPFCGIVAYEHGRVVMGLEEMAKLWHRDPAVRKILADEE